MKLHITNLHGQPIDCVGQKAQNTVTDIVRKAMDCRELGIYWYNVNHDSEQMLLARLDGIIAGVNMGDIVVFQYPTWNDIRFDEAFIGRLKNYAGLKKIFLIHDLSPLMEEEKRPLLGRHISLCNQADVIILPSQRMADFLRSKGLTVEKIVILKMFDFPVDIDQHTIPQFKKVINFAGNPDNPKFDFVKKWNYNEVELSITASDGGWTQGRNISFLGWFRNDNLLTNALRKKGGFGIVWSDDSYWREYMKLNANYKLSAYLAAGLPVIVNSEIAEKDTVIRKNLGLVVDSLDEAVDKVSNMDEEKYKRMVADVGSFSNLLREGYFIKKALTDAVFQLLYD